MEPKISGEIIIFADEELKLLFLRHLLTLCTIFTQHSIVDDCSYLDCGSGNNEFIDLDKIVFVQKPKVEINYPPNLKAIGIHAPHAYAICLGIKKDEYRTQPTNRRGWILIHASQSKQSNDYFADYGINKTTIKRGAIIGAVKIISCVRFAGDYAYQLTNPIKFSHPVEEVKGKQSIF